jgi:hypothetical protein
MFATPLKTRCSSSILACFDFAGWYKRDFAIAPDGERQTGLAMLPDDGSYGSAEGDLSALGQ